MGTKVIVKFRIRPRRAKAPATGKSKSSTENLLITMRVTYGGLRMEFSTGFSIDAGKWDAKEGRSIGKDESDNKINDGLMQIVSHVHYTVDYFRVKEIEPTQGQFKETFKSSGMVPSYLPDSSGSTPSITTSTSGTCIRSTSYQTVNGSNGH